MKTIHYSLLSIVIASFTFSHSAVAVAQLFPRAQSSQEPHEQRPLTVFGGQGIRNADDSAREASNFRLFPNRNQDDQVNGNAGSMPSMFGGQGVGSVPFQQGRLKSNHDYDDWDDDETNRNLFRPFGGMFNNSSTMRPARRYEMTDRPRWLGNRPSLFASDSDDPNLIERMNQRSRDFWSDSSSWMQERNQAMRTRRQETWESMTRGFRTAPDRPDFETTPPSFPGSGNNDRPFGAGVDRY